MQKVNSFRFVESDEKSESDYFSAARNYAELNEVQSVLSGTAKIKDQ